MAEPRIHTADEVISVAIHDRHGSFSKKWIEFCKQEGIEYCLVDLFDSDILAILRKRKVTHLLFHFGTGEYKTSLLLKNLCRVLEIKGIQVFPGSSEYWHYDDKLSQKYLFEQLQIPHAPMRVFYSKEKALEWAREPSNYPFVFKLKAGAGSKNVQLVKNESQARRLIRTMFGKGIKPVPSILVDTGPKIRNHNRKKDWGQVLLRAPRTLYNNLRANRYLPSEKGYFLTQVFYPGNEYDTRVAIIGDKAFAFRRHVRTGDFRASGSGLIDYDPLKIDPMMIDIAFDAAAKIGSVSSAFDFIYDPDGNPKILEVSYCYVSELLVKSGGYWTRDLIHHSTPLIPEHEIIRTLLSGQTTRTLLEYEYAGLDDLRNYQ